MKILYKNNAGSTLASGISDSVLSLTVKTGEGDVFPSPGLNECFFVTLTDTSKNREIVKVSSRTSDTFTIVRAQEGTTARAFSADDKVELLITSGILEDVRDNSLRSDRASTASSVINFTTEIQLDASAGDSGKVLTSRGSGLSPEWTTPAAGGGGGTVSDETESTNTFYPTFSNVSTGSYSPLVSSTKLNYQPSTGTFSSTYFSSTSDKSLKEEIVDIENALDIIEQLRPVKFKWVYKDEYSFGLIAQEVKDILPELISESSGYMGIKYNLIIPFLIDSIKELNKRIKELEKNVSL